MESNLNPSYRREFGSGCSNYVYVVCGSSYLPLWVEVVFENYCWLNYVGNSYKGVHPEPSRCGLGSFLSLLRHSYVQRFSSQRH